MKTGKIFIIDNKNSNLPENMATGAKLFFEKELGLTDDTATILYQDSEIWCTLVLIGKNADYYSLESARKQGVAVNKQANQGKIESIEIVNCDANEELALSFAEGLELSNYQFLQYINADSKKKKQNSLKSIAFLSKEQEKWIQLQKINEAVFAARDLVNEPVLSLNAEGLANEFKNMGEKFGFEVEIWNEAQIESQKMGGLLAVNKGSQEPPTFTIMTYKPTDAVNANPVILVGKGVVFDTGGLSLKPTPASMEYMKCDMAGAAVVGAAMQAIASLKLPLYIIGLVPATDNRPGENAICPGDIITTYDGTTVEVLNTDAEGRLILCDALALAKKYNPELVLDFATLTGAAARAIGPYGIAMMGTANENIKSSMKKAGENVYERTVELPIWKEYEDEMKGDISDLKNLGKGEAGAQTAAAFLKHFTHYPWLHFDIAGPAFLTSADAYRTKGGSGVGVRLILSFLQRYLAGLK